MPEGSLHDHANRKREKSKRAKEQEEKAAQEETKRLNANVPQSMHKAVRMEAARRGVEMKTVIMNALEEHLPNYPPE